MSLPAPAPKLTGAWIAAEAARILASHDIAVIEPNDENPEQQIVDQYNKITDDFSQMDQKAFDLGLTFIKSAQKIAPENETIKALAIINQMSRTALNSKRIKLLEDYLEKTPKRPARMDVHLTLADAYSDREQYGRAVEHMKAHIVETKSEKIIGRLCRTYLETGKNTSGLLEFVEQCADEKIMPRYDSQALLRMAKG